MDRGLYIAASGMVAQELRQDQLSNELANASTPGYKPDRVGQRSFEQLLLGNTVTGQSIGTIDLGVQAVQEGTDLNPQPLHDTGQPLDFGIEGTGYFAVRTPQGVRYTRDGQFSASAQGLLVDGSGDPVLGAGGNTIPVSGSSVSANALGVFNLGGATKVGDNQFTGTVTGRSTSVVRAGSLEDSGVDTTKTMLDVLANLRYYQSGQQSIQAVGADMRLAATQVGNLGGGAG
jgi:flagellar basal-body rod protein FlgF